MSTPGGPLPALAAASPAEHGVRPWLENVLGKVA